MNDDADPEPLEPKADKEPDEQPDREPDKEPDEDRGGRRTTLLIVGAAVVVLAAIAFGIYLIATSGDNDVAADPAPPTISDVKPSETPSKTLPPDGKPASSAAPHSTAAPPPVSPNIAAARGIAENAAEAINERDIAAMKQVTCDPGTVGSVESFPPGATARLTGDPEITGDKATAQIELSISDSEPTIVPLPLEKHGGRWCVP